jgi:hypothetical protein
VEVLGLAVFHFEGVLPFDIGVELAVLQIDVDGLRAHVDHALERVQLRAGEEHVHITALGPQLARQLRILEPGLIAQAQEKSLGALDAEHLDQLASARCHHRNLDQQHALFIQPDFPSLPRKRTWSLRSLSDGGCWVALYVVIIQCAPDL